MTQYSKIKKDPASQGFRYVQYALHRPRGAMKLACPYCGAPIGDGAPTHLTPVRYMPTGVSTTFKMIPVEQILSGESRPPLEYRVIQSCPSEGCKAAAAQVQTRVPR